MPPLQQLARSYRSCQMLAHMHLLPGSAHLHCLRPLGPSTSTSISAVPVTVHPFAHQRCSRVCCSSSFTAGGHQIGTTDSRRPVQQQCIFSSSSSRRVNGRQQQVCHASSSSSSSSSSSQPSTPQPSSGSSRNTLLTLPTMLTLGRVAAIPALIAAWFGQDPAASTAVTALFVVASITDWLDGYLARKMNASTPFGAFLDPVADKLMVAAVLILLSTQPLAAGPFAGNTWFVPVATLIIIGREISMSALREWAATLGPAAKAAVAVNAWGKWKTAAQMVALTCLLLTKDGAQGQLGVAAAAAGPPLLAIAAYLTAHSLAVYVAGLWKFLK